MPVDLLVFEPVECLGCAMARGWRRRTRRGGRRPRRRPAARPRPTRRRLADGVVKGGDRGGERFGTGELLLDLVERQGVAVVHQGFVELRRARGRSRRRVRRPRRRSRSSSHPSAPWWASSSAGSGRRYDGFAAGLRASAPTSSRSFEPAGGGDEGGRATGVRATSSAGVRTWPSIVPKPAARLGGDHRAGGEVVGRLAQEGRRSRAGPRRGTPARSRRCPGRGAGPAACGGRSPASRWCRRRRCPGDETRRRRESQAGCRRARRRPP